MLFRGSSSVEPIDGIELKRCVTYKQLAKYKVRLLENVKKEDIEQVKQLPKEGSTYSIGACDVAIKNITLYVKDLYEILNEKDAVLKEKEKSIRVLKETTEKNVSLEKDLANRDESISELREQIKNLNIEKDKNLTEIEELTKKNKALQDKLTAETNLRIETQGELQNYKDNLGVAIEETEAKIGQKEQELTNQHQFEIEQIKNIIKEKDTQIREQSDKITELTKLNEELGKAGTIPDIPYSYSGRASIIGVCGKGSYGVSSFTHCLAKLINEQKKVLVVDLDFKGGNLNKYFKSDSYLVENHLKGGPILCEHLISYKGKILDYISGVQQYWTPYQILNIDWNKIFSFDPEYDYIICDIGIYGGYNIQTKVVDLISRLGKVVCLYRDESQKIDGFINIKNFASRMDGIPFISKILANDTNLYDEPITKEYIKSNILNKVVL